MAVALILAAGSGERLGAGRPKAWVELGGRPMLDWSIAALLGAPSVGQLIVAVPPGWVDAGVLTREVPDTSVELVEGGRSRSESVLNALRAARGEEHVVLVHDAARPLLSAQLAEDVIAALQADPRADAAIAAAPVTDTIKRAGHDGGEVRETLDRRELWAVQTPQVFRRSVLARALDVDLQTLAGATDDAWLVEQGGGRVRIVPAPAENIKVTTPVDLRLAAMLLAGRRAEATRNPA